MPPQSSAVEKGVETLNSLLRGEISAAETYNQAIAKIRGDRASEARQLRAIAQEHGETAQRLRECIRRLGGEANDSSGAWGAWSKVVQGAMDLFGDRSALKALKQGEEHGVNEFRDALPNLDSASRTLASETLIPAALRHIATLDGLITSD